VITTLLIDADIVAFQFASANQEDFDWGDGVASRTVEELTEVAPQIDAKFSEWKSRWKADDIIVCLSCPHEENFRLSILPTYKGHRDYSNRPVLLKPIKDYFAANYRTYSRPTLEADDVMGILSTHPKLVPGRKVIVSEDKDMQSIPGWLWNPAKDRKPRMISKEGAERYHLYQTLIGDAADNYKGCPGVGPEAAQDILDNNIGKVPYEHEYKRGPKKGTTETRYEKIPMQTRWAAIVSWFESHGLTHEDALVQARVARICRAEDYDFGNKRVKEWNPN